MFRFHIPLLLPHRDDGGDGGGDRVHAHDPHVLHAHDGHDVHGGHDDGGRHRHHHRGQVLRFRVPK